MDKLKKETWANKDLWNQFEFSALCAGLEPKENLIGDKSLNEIGTTIHRARLAGKIPHIDMPNATKESILYGFSIFFVPHQVVTWANKHFPQFPFKPEDIPDPAADKPEMGEREKDTLLKMIGALAMLVANKGGKYKKKDDPNALQIADDVASLFEETDKFDKHGLSSRNLREKISEGINLLTY